MIGVIFHVPDTLTAMDSDVALNLPDLEPANDRFLAHEFKSSPREAIR